MGNQYDAMWHKFEQHAKSSGFLAGMTKEEKRAYYGRMTVRIQDHQNAQLAQGLSGKGTSTLPAVITPQTSTTQTLPAVITDPIEISTKNDGIRVAKKWAKGKNCYLADGSGNFYKVDKTTYNAATTGKKIQLATKDVVDFDKLPKEAQNQFKKYLPKPSEAAKQEIAETAANAVKNSNPSNPSNAVLGTAKADPKTFRDRLPANWDDVASNNTQQISNQARQVSGVVEADRRAQEIINQNKQNLQGSKVQTPNHNYNLVYEPEKVDIQARINKKHRIGEEVNWKEIYNENPSHPSNATLGTTKADPRKWYERKPAKYEDVIPGYKQPTSGVVDADKIAEEIIEQNKQNVTNTTDDIAKFASQFDEMGQKIDGLSGKVDKLGNGFGKAFGKANAKIDDLGKNVVGLTDKVDDIAGNVDKLKRGLGEVSGKIISKVDGNTQAITDLAGDVGKVAGDVSKLKRGLGEVSGKIIGKVDDNSSAIKELAGKVDDMAKSNRNLALFGLGAVAVAAIAGYFFGKALNDDKEDASKATPETTTGGAAGATPEQPSKEVQEPAPETTPETTPETPIAVVPEEPSKEAQDPTPEKVEPTPESVKPESEKQEDSKMHKVIEGDNCWNIAKAELKKEYEKAGKDPNTVTNKEIRKRTEKIIEANKLKWEADGYTVIIHPGDKLDVAA